MKERWLWIAGFEGLYKVSNEGRVRSFIGRNGQSPGIMSPDNHRCGYFRLKLSSGDTELSKYVHRLVAMAFIPNPDKKPFVNHKNGNKKDNRQENLEWCTAKENSKHAVSLGLIKHRRGVDNKNSKLTNELALEAFNASGSISEIADRYNVSATVIGFIKIGKTWSHVTGKKYVRKRPPGFGMKKASIDPNHYFNRGKNK